MSVVVFQCNLIYRNSLWRDLIWLTGCSLLIPVSKPLSMIDTSGLLGLLRAFVSCTCISVCNSWALVQLCCIASHISHCGMPFKRHSLGKYALLCCWWDCQLLVGPLQFLQRHAHPPKKACLGWWPLLKAASPHHRILAVVKKGTMGLYFLIWVVKIHCSTKQIVDWYDDLFWC